MQAAGSYFLHVFKAPGCALLRWARGALAPVLLPSSCAGAARRPPAHEMAHGQPERGTLRARGERVGQALAVDAQDPGWQRGGGVPAGPTGWAGEVM